MNNKNSPDFICSAPGKTILFGEHAVVYGTNAIATVIDYRCFGSFSINTTNKIILKTPIKEMNRIWEYNYLYNIYKKNQDIFNLSLDNENNFNLIQKNIT